MGGNMPDTKLTKRKVNYRTASIGSRLIGRQCGSCSMFKELRTNGPGQCTLVEGNIYPKDVCDRWEAKS